MNSNHGKCQSCGMPMKRDAQGGGTNRDGSRNPKYCSHCFLNGEFTLPDLSVGEMQDRVKIKLREIGIPGFLAAFFTRGIPDLERWRAS